VHVKRGFRHLVLVGVGALCGITWNAMSGRGFELTAHVFIGEGDELIDAVAAKKRFDYGALFIDARVPIAFEFGHVPQALLIPEDQFDRVFPALEKRLRGRLDIVVYCDGYGCESSHHVARKLKQHGIPAVILENGFPAWKEAGYPALIGGQT
jgi:rhodanese-related sulfurtransferase